MAKDRPTSVVRQSRRTRTDWRRSTAELALVLPVGSFVTATAADSGGDTSEFSHTIPATPPLASIADAEASPDDTSVAVLGIASAVVSDDVFYVEAENRTCGIQVFKPGHGIVAGRELIVQGRVSASDPEVELLADQLTDIGSGVVLPLAMTNKAMAGGGYRYDPTAHLGQRGADDGNGLNNVGLLVTTMGVVSDATDDSFEIGDGSGVPVKVNPVPGLTPPSSGAFVQATGISSLYLDGGSCRRLLVVTRQEDILVRREPPQP